jgi:pilus assembly protein Flp/PilA
MSDAMMKLFVSARTLMVRDVERGASLVEYALLVALIALIAIGGITLLGQNTDATLTDIANEVGG